MVVAVGGQRGRVVGVQGQRRKGGGGPGGRESFEVEDRGQVGRGRPAADQQVVELGPVNATIHKVDECVLIEDLETLSAIYQGILERLLINHT